MKRTIFFFLISITWSRITCAQSYFHVDSTMKEYKEKIKSADNLYKVIYFIRNNFKEDSLRLRASFIWITENIAYDVKAFREDNPVAGTIDYHYCPTKSSIKSFITFIG